MLSYQHVYHAGNHADVLKHTTLVMLLEHLNAKHKPYTVIDTHAGSGRYNSDDERALKTREADSGIGKLLHDDFCDDGIAQYNAMARDAACGGESTVHAGAAQCTSFMHYRNFVKACCARGFYPGSPEIARAFMRSDDNLILCELHKAEFSALKNNMKCPPVAVDADGAVAENAGMNGTANVVSAGTKNEIARGEAGAVAMLSDFLCSAANATTPKIARGEANAADTTLYVPRGFVQVHVHCRDGFDALTSLTPPKIKRGLVLVDPSYEDADEYERVPLAFASLAARWSSAIFALWYPLLFHRRIECSTMKQKIIARAKGSARGCSIVCGELCVNAENAHVELPLAKKRKNAQSGLSMNNSVTQRWSDEYAARADNPPRLYGSGMLIVNAPWKLAENMEAVLPYLAQTLGTDGHGSWSVDCY